MTHNSESGARCEMVVSIINYRTPEMTIRCVESVLADIGGRDVQVVVVDNRSDDGSADAIAQWIEAAGAAERVTLLRSRTNSGYSGGHNQGVAARAAETVLILNSDALVRPGALAALSEALRRNPRAGLAAPLLEHEDGVAQISCFRFPSPVSEFTRGAGLAALTSLFRSRQVALSVAPAPEEIEWVSFACVLLRRDMIEEIGPMDEGFFMYFEDAEYCLRARRAGWEIVHVPQARVVHLRGGSAPVKSLAKARKRVPAYFYASRARFLHAAYGHSGLLAANLLWTLGRGLSFLKVFDGRWPKRVRREATDLWINFLSPRGDRRAPEGAER